MSRETMLAATFVELADTLVSDFDVVDVLSVLTERCVDVLDVDAAGLMLVAPSGELRVMASSSEATRLLELFEVQSRSGPCVDCFRQGIPVSHDDLTKGSPWPEFEVRSVQAGFRSVQALPMRLRTTIIGALNLFHIEPGPMRDFDVRAAQSLADIATIATLQHRALREMQEVNEQLSEALHSRVVIEQAKGMIAERGSLDMDQAFAQLRNHARATNRRLTDLARDVISGAWSGIAD